MTPRKRDHTSEPSRFTCGCLLLGGGWKGCAPSAPIPFSAPNLCAKHASDLSALLVRRDGWILEQADALIAKSFAGPGVA